MNEGLSDNSTEAVWWINAHDQLRRGERIRKWLFEIADRGTYMPKEQIPFSTSIKVSEIKSLADPYLREALTSQHNDHENAESFITVPVASFHTQELLHSLSVPVAYTRRA